MSSKPHTFKARIAFDAILSALLVVEMFFQLTGDFLHEVLGVVFFICIAAHLVLSRAWIAGTSAAIKGKRMTARRWLLAIMGILLALAMIALVVSSLMISQVLSSAGISLAVAGTGEVWYLVHVASSYLLCALVVVHLAMHWIAVASVFRVPYNPARRKAIGAAVNTVAVVGVVALGATGFGAAGDALASVGSQASNGNGSGSGSGSGSGTGSGSDTGERRRRGHEVSSGALGQGTYGDGSGAGGGSGSSSDSGSSNGASGTCPLCHKNCPLSAPQCNRPYEAGLI